MKLKRPTTLLPTFIAILLSAVVIFFGKSTLTIKPALADQCIGSYETGDGYCGGWDVCHFGNCPCGCNIGCRDSWDNHVCFYDSVENKCWSNLSYSCAGFDYGNCTSHGGWCQWCVSAQTCPTSCGYGGGSVPNGSCGTTSCAATASCGTCAAKTGCSSSYPGYSYSYVPSPYPGCPYGPPWPNWPGDYSWNPGACCTAAQSCPTACGYAGGTVPNGSCGTTSCAATASCCTPETDSQFCSRLGKNCDNVTANNNCGTPRTVNCGSCTAPQTCGGGGTANVCGCTASCSGKICGAANGCGGTCAPGSGCIVTGALTVATTPTTISPTITLKDSGGTTVGTGNGPSKAFTIPSGTYSVTYGNVTDYDSPTPNPKAVTFDAASPMTVTGNYTAQPGTLAVRTTPFATIKVDGVSWNYTPQTRPISAGFHTITFGALTGYYTPGTQTVEVKSNKTTTVNVTYVLNSGVPLPTSELQLFEARYTWREVVPII